MPVLIAVTHFYLGRSAQSMSELVSAAEKAALSGDTDKAVKEIDAFNSAWGKNRAIYATFIRHAEIDLANQSAAKLTPYLAAQDKSEFLGECETLRLQILHIAETERFNFGNIL